MIEPNEQDGQQQESGGMNGNTLFFAVVFLVCFVALLLALPSGWFADYACGMHVVLMAIVAFLLASAICLATWLVIFLVKNR